MACPFIIAAIRYEAETYCAQGLHQEALAVYEFLNDLAEAIWNRYEVALIEQLCSERDYGDTSQLDFSGATRNLQSGGAQDGADVFREGEDE